MSLPVFVTGVLPGNKLIGTTAEVTDGSEMIVTRGRYPPGKEYYQSISQKERERILREVQKISAQAEISFDHFVRENQAPTKELYLNEVKDELYVNVIKLSKEFEKKLGQARVAEIISRSEIGLREFYSYFVSPTRREGKRVTLIFRPGLWSVAFDIQAKVSSFSGYVWSVLDRKFIKGARETRDEKLFLFELSDETIGILQPTSQDLTKLEFYELIAEVTGDSMIKIKEIAQEIAWFTPALYKSCLQKIIRTGCQQVETLDKIYNAHTFLCVTFIELYLTPGSFVPNLQTYVKGETSAFKRLAVSISEDSYTDDYYLVAELLCYALRSINTHVTLDLETWTSLFKLCGDVIRSQRMFDYSFPEKYDSGDAVQNEYFFAAHLLQEVKSLKSDIPMFFMIAKHGGRKRERYYRYPIPVMRAERCIDHHARPQIAYFYPHTRIEFKLLFNQIFQFLTGVNPRKPQKGTPDQAFIKETESVQELLWLESYPPKERKVRDTTLTLNAKIDDSWVSALIGVMKVKVGKKLILVCVRPDNISDLVTIEQPTKKQEQIGPLSEAEKEKAIELAERALKEGYRPQKIPLSLKWLAKDYQVFLEETKDGYEYFIKIRGEKLSWEEFSYIPKEFHLHPKLKGDILENSLTWRGSGIEVNGLKSIDQLIADILADVETNFELITRILYYISGTKSEITLANISRDGDGVEYQVFPIDIDVHFFLAELSVRAPGIIARKNLTTFEVLYPPYVWEIHEKLLNGLYIRKKFLPWQVDVYDRTERELYDYQVEVIKYLEHRPRKGNLLWLKMGAGKTLIVLKYAQRLIESNKMPKYFVYTLPLGAIATVTKEIEMMGFEINLLDPRGNKKKLIVQPYVINLIGHDHMKNDHFHEQLLKYGQELFLVVDEVHLCINPTKRTTAMLKITKLCYKFIGMSGTVIKDRNIKFLIPWLEQLVTFEVTEHNFWIAMTSVVSKKIDLNLPTTREVISIDLTQTEQVKHSQYLQTKNYEGFRKAVIIARRACTNLMLADALDLYDQNKVSFVVLDTKANQTLFQDKLIKSGVSENEIYLISSKSPINYDFTDRLTYRILITTVSSSTGYSITKANYMLTSVYFTGQHVRDQMEGRLIRPTQKNHVYLRTYSAGILDMILKNYNAVRNMASAFEYALMTET